MLMRDIFTFMRDLGWQEDPAGSATYFRSADRRYLVVCVPRLEWWAFGRYDEEDEFDHVNDGKGLEALCAELRMVPAETLIPLTRRIDEQVLKVLAEAGCTPGEAKLWLEVFERRERNAVKR